MEKSFETLLAEKIASAQKDRDAKIFDAKLQVLENAAFIETQRAITAKTAEIAKLNNIIIQLNNIKPFVANDGSKYSIRVYPVSYFGNGIGQILGIINGARSAFTEELAMQYAAITGLSIIELLEAKDAFGSVAYCDKEGKVHDAIEGNVESLIQLLSAICLKLDINEFSPNSINKDKVALYFAKAELDAIKKATEYTRAAALDTEDYTLEDTAE